MTKSMYDNLDMMVAAHAAAKAIKRENALKGMPLPLHPGAERYYKEKGLIIKRAETRRTRSRRRRCGRPVGGAKGAP